MDGKFKFSAQWRDLAPFVGNGTKFKGGNYLRKYGKLFTVMDGKFKFQVQDGNLEYLFWRFDKHIAFSEKKLPLIISYHIQSGPKAFKLVRIGCAIKQ